MKKTFCVFVGILWMCAALLGCEAKQPPLGELFPRQSVERVRISYRRDAGDLHSELGYADAICAALLDAVYSASESELELASYSPELKATHTLTLVADGTLKVYFDASANLLSVPGRRQGDDGQPVRTYHQYTADLAGLLAMLEDTIQQPEESAHIPALSPESLLHAEIVQAELEKPGVDIPYEHFTYETQVQEPQYSLFTYQDQVEGLENGYLLLVAAWGARDTGGYEIDIAGVQENESYYLVYVTFESPAQDAAEGGASYPTAAALLDARRMMQDKLVVFLTDQHQVLGVSRLDPEFLRNIPGDMPPLEEPEEIDGAD